MIYDNIETGSIHINTVLHMNSIHFKNLTMDTVNVMQYKIKLKTTNKIKLISFFDTKMFSEMEDGKLQSFDIDWGDGSGTKVFTENINTEVYNTDSRLKLEHDYVDIPTDQEIIVTIMGEFESLCPIAFDNTIDGIEVVSFGGVLDSITNDIVKPLRPHLRNKLTDIYSLHTATGKNLLHNYKGTKLNKFLSDIPELLTVDINIFSSELGGVTEAIELFKNDSKLSNLPFFMNFDGLVNVTSVAENCSSLVQVVTEFSNPTVTNFTSAFKNCTSLTYLDEVNFSGKSDLVVKDMLNGCSSYVEVYNEDLFTNATFRAGESINGLFANIEELNITITEENDPRPSLANMKNFSRLFNNSFCNLVFPLELIENLSINNSVDMFATSSNLNLDFVNIPYNSMSLIDSNVNITRMFKNRNLEIPRVPFNFTTNSVNYIDCFIGSKSLYNDEQIFKEYYNLNMRSGLTPIRATIVYTVEIAAGTNTLKFSTVYNKYNPDMNPELDAVVDITIGGVTTTLNKSDIEAMKTTGGIKSIPVNVVGLQTVTVSYTHCAPFTLTYENTSDYTKYTIKSANIELFPTDIPYIGKYGLELWSAENITGDFFSLFYDRPNVTPQTYDPNKWIDGLFAYFSSKVKSVSNDILKNISLVGTITEINNLFRYNYSSDRDIFNSFTYYYINKPFTIMNVGEILRFLTEVTTIKNWMNASEFGLVMEISGGKLDNLVSNFRKLKVVYKLLESCKLDATTPTEIINWSNNVLLEEVTTYIGRPNYLAKDLLMLPKLKKVNRLHAYAMISGMDKDSLADCFMDFANSSNDIDLTEMFAGEKFEIPDRFIRNVKGTLKFNNCFAGSYRFDIPNDSSIFENVNAKFSGDVSGMAFVSLEEPLVLTFREYGNETGNIGLVIKDKDGDTHRVISRVYVTKNNIRKLESTNHSVISLDDNIRSISCNGATKIELELWCKTANVYLKTLEAMQVDTLSGYYSRTQWVDKVRMQDAYPGLVPSKIICTDDGGPWRKITPTNGVINFTEMFTGIANKDLIDYRILKTNSPAKTTYNLTGTFKNGSIADFDIRMFEFIGDMLINGISLFESNSDKNFNFVNLESGPYIFMEILFKKIVNATGMFKWAAMPYNIFNGAQLFGCDRNGNMLNSDEMVIQSISSMFSKYQDPNNFDNDVTATWPVWKPNIIYPLRAIADFLNSRKIQLNPNLDYSVLPNNETTLNANSYFRYYVVNGVNNVLDIDILNLQNATDFNYGIYMDRETVGQKYNLKRDYEWIKINSSIISMLNMTNGKIGETDPLFKYLMQPFQNAPNSTVSLRDTFAYFKTYAPDNILFRNVKSFTGTSGAELLTYPNYIEYQNIHLTGNQVTFIREELDPNHRFSTYLTVFINYGSGYEEAKWFIVDKNADSYTIDLETSKITNNIVSIKIQSTQCFYLMKTNVDYVEKLEGTYRKDLQPRDSEFFNFDVDYYYFIERFGADLWKDVKIKQSDKFSFGFKNTSGLNMLKAMDGSPFRTQSHITNISRLFYNCPSFIPTNTVLIGFENVTSSFLIFSGCGAINDIPVDILKPLIKTHDLGDSFKSLSDITSIPTELFKHNTEALFLNNMFTYANILNHIVLPKDFWDNISNSVYRLTSMFGNVTGIGKERTIGSVQFISDNSFRFRAETIANSMFNNTKMLDIRVSWIKEGSLNSNNSVDMWKSCSTYDEQSLFESRYGNQTGVTFKCHEACIYRSSTTNLTGRFKLLFSEPTLDKNSEYVKIVTDNDTYYKTINELETSGLYVATTKIEVYSDYAIIFDCINVERLEGKFPTHDGRIFDMSNFNLGQKYPNLKYIDPLFFSKLINQSDMSYVFRELRDINIIPSTLFNPMVNLNNVESMYSYAGGTINNLADITNFIGTSDKITNMSSLFKRVSIKQIGRKAIKIRNSGAVNLSEMFDNTHAYIDNDTFEGTPSSINVTGMFNTCKSLYSIDELTALTKTGDSLLEILKSFRPVIGLTNANSEVNLMVLHDSPDNAKIVDVLVDWGDGNSNIMIGVRTDSITHISKVIASSGDKTLRIWCSYYGVGVKLKTDIAGSIVKHAGGYVGKYISPNYRFTNTYFPEARTTDSEYLWDVMNQTDVVFINHMSKLTSVSARFYKNIHNSYTRNRIGFESMRELNSISELVFVDMKSSFQSDLDCTWMFASTSKISVLPPNIWDPITKISMINGLFSSSSITVTADIFRPIAIRLLLNEYDMTRTFASANIILIENVIQLISNGKIKSMQETFNNTNITVSDKAKFIIDIDKFVDNRSIIFAKAFLDARFNNSNRLDIPLFNKCKETLTFSANMSLGNIQSVFTESEIFSNNTITGSSGLITDPRTVMSMRVTAGTLNLLTFNNPAYTGKLLIKINNRVHSLNPYANKSITVNENDLVEVITFNNIKDAYITIDLNTSTSKVKELGGIYNIGPLSIVDGKFNKTILECFGSDVTTISDTFFTQFNTVTNASNLCKGLINLTGIPNGAISKFTSNTNWNSFFENCEKFNLTSANSEMFIVANKGISYDYMFKNCTSLNMIPARFFKGCVEPNKTFYATFTNTRITALPDDIDDF